MRETERNKVSKNELKNGERVSWNLSSLAREKEFSTSEGWGRYNVAKKYKTRILYHNRLLKIAVVLAIVFITGTLFFNYRDKQDISTVMGMVQTIVPNGSKVNIILPDGTTVWLNAGSKLTYPSFFNGEERIVHLEGEAFFDVVTNPDRPFLVKTQDAVVKALGTTFNVKAYKEEGIIETTLIEGVVGITKKGIMGEIKLRPNQKITLIGNTVKKEMKEVVETIIKEEVGQSNKDLAELSSTKIILEKQVDTKTISSWKDSNWIIAEESLVSLAIKLERRYDVNIEFKDDELKRVKFSGTLKDESVEQVLTYMSQVSSMEYTIDGKQVVFYKNE